MKRPWPLLALVLGACTVGSGTGEVKGQLYILDCNTDAPVDFGTRMAPKDFDLRLKFFAAEQLLHLGTTGATAKVNRLIIRLQSSGRRREANDILRFDIPDSRAVALCVANQKDELGQPAYDPKNCFQGPNGARLRVAPNGLVRATLTPNFTCASQIVATAIANETATDGNWESWIELAAFGNAAPGGRIEREFKIEINGRLHAPSFSLTLKDDVVFKAEIDILKPPVPDPRIGGAVAGSFDFDMQRGQGAQTFP